MIEMIEQISIDLSNYCSKQCPFCYNHSRPEGRRPSSSRSTPSPIIVFKSTARRTPSISSLSASATPPRLSITRSSPTAGKCKPS